MDAVGSLNPSLPVSVLAQSSPVHLKLEIRFIQVLITGYLIINYSETGFKGLTNHQQLVLFYLKTITHKQNNKKITSV